MGAPFSPGSRFAYALAIFSSAFLLFQVQPILGKMIMPRFGGAAAVWIVCLMFFQVALLLGYFYAHLLTRKLYGRTRAAVHVAILVASLLALPILPKSGWNALPSFHPAFQIVCLLGVTVGLPYFLLSATSPLLQAWYSRNDPGAAPYRFYAVSNIGSMLALISYPVVVEPWVSTSHQAVAWSWAYAAFVLLCAALAISAGVEPGLSPAPAAPGPPTAPAPPRPLQFLWLSLAACGSALLLAITHHISENIASVPLLWIIPLAIYLLTFILCFDGRAWYQRAVFLRLLGVALGAMAYALAPSFSSLPLVVSIPLYCGCLFVCCMFCHGELARTKPHPAHLTSFYLMTALGGAAGALFVALVAPAVFSGDYELRLALASCALLVLVVYHRDPTSPFYRARWQPGWLLLIALAITLIVTLAVTAREEAANARLMVRNFYGVLKVVDGTVGASVTPAASRSAVPDPRYRKLVNGTIDHGLQFLAPARRDQPTTYYGPHSGIGITLAAENASAPLYVGVIGLGAGTLAAYGRLGDRYRFYEINPLVVRVAQQEFSFLRDSAAKIDIVLGDARLSLEHEPHQGFDVLVVDAFSGDSIPVHLLTREAFALYFRHLNPAGVLALHVSNQYVDLTPVVAGAASWFGKEAVKVQNPADDANEIYQATWVLVGSPRNFIAETEVERAGSPLAVTPLQWTDDYSSLFRILK